jgi:hypothetical protein
MFMASMLGSSWKMAEMSGVAPMMSPAATTTVLGLVPARFWMWVARYSTPPAATDTGAAGAGGRAVITLPDEPVGGFRLP